MASERKAASAEQLLAQLRNGPYPLGSHAWLYEVRNATGWGGNRSADALVVSCWPSRGIWIAGLEVKVSRADWVRELRDPDKSAAVQRYCDYWWVVAPPDVVQLAELPETWGLYVVDGKKVSIGKPAPKLSAEPLTAAFVASVLRNESSKLEEARKRGHAEGFEARSQQDSGKRVDGMVEELLEARRERDRFQRELEHKERELAMLRAEHTEFEREAGLPPGSLTRQRGSQRHVGAQFALAGVLASHPPGRLVMALRHALAGLEKLDAVQQPQIPPRAVSADG